MTIDSLRKSWPWRIGNAVFVVAEVVALMILCCVPWQASLGMGLLIYIGFLCLHLGVDDLVSILAVYAFVAGAGYGMVTNYANYSCTGVYWPIGLLWGACSGGIVGGIGQVMTSWMGHAPEDSGSSH